MTLSGSACIPRHILHRAWNGFARLLQIDWEEDFVCPVCGPYPDTVICDGTAIGFSKKHMAIFEEEEEEEGIQTEYIEGSRQQDRVFLTNLRIRKLVCQYGSGLQLAPEEFQEILDYTFTQPHLYSLHNLLNNLQGNLTCPNEYRFLLKNIGYNSPASAFLQGASDEGIAVLQEMLLQRTPFFASGSRTQLQFLSQHFPVVLALMQPFARSGALPDVMYCLLYDLAERAKASFSVERSAEPGYPGPTIQTKEEMFKGVEFFPNLHQLHG